jgi:hypothetical protein
MINKKSEPLTAVVYHPDPQPHIFINSVYADTKKQEYKPK